MAILSVSSFGIHMIYLNVLIKKTRPTWANLGTTVLALAGVYLILPDFDLTNDLTTGILVGLASAFSLPFYPLFSNNITKLMQ